MPGRQLSATERRLQKWWNSRAATEFPLLNGISIQSAGDGLRGIRQIDVAFTYPVTVIAGPNGAGKTTVLGLAALGFHGVPDHFPRSAKRLPKAGETFTYYTFQDFFFRGPGDQDMSGLEIGWRYENSPDLCISKQSDKWMRYERRPARPVHYFGISRAVPAIEQSVLRSHFGFQRKAKGVQLSEQAVKWVGHILQRNYSEAEKLSSLRYGLRRCQSSKGAGYSSFNMGAGEDLLFDLIGTIDNSQAGSLILIEEIEVGIHASALRRLAEVLQEIAWKKKLQIIVSSHSEQFIDALPRQARILLRREGDAHRVIPNVSSGYIFSDLSGAATPELKIFCEDGFARRVIECGLRPEIRPRVQVQAVGDKCAVADIAVFHVFSDKRTPCLVIWDGDVTEAEANSIAKAASEKMKVDTFSFLRLPGSQPPERAVVEAIRANSKAIELLAINTDSTEGVVVSALDAALGEANHHSMPREISRRLGLGEPEVVIALAQAVARSGALDLQYISDAIERLL